ncbi:glycosyltransferase family 2 protein [Rhizorhabdus wittichii]|uniref:Glycosyltransferase family 2 protein n=1 Tax=Rhizorhabdus wittichii TaxID=160791 RepID=A0A975D0E4_9SPHN|nr:glycosyltransferase family A protein [Rhizorhabdus wittichii]QTH20582.1 glycosyltransferase family 2 protein [Rhizorhabdus wittichii]
MTTQSSERRPAAVTVVIPAYRVGAMLHDAIDSVLAQDRTDWEIVVIDDGDRDAAAHVAPYLADPRIRFLETDNGGPSTARNRAMATVTTPYVALLDGDDVYEPDFLSSMIAALEASPRIGFVTSDATFFGADREGELFSAYCPQQLPATLDRVLRREFNIFGLTVMRREAIMGIGGFDTSIISSEDFDGWLRLLEAGWELAYVPRPIVRYRRRANQASRNSGGMLRTALTVTGRARERLAGRPEAKAAEEMCDRIARQIMIDDAFTDLEQGRVKAALAGFDRAGPDLLGPRWRRALRVIRVAPFLAPLLLRLRKHV